MTSSRDKCKAKPRFTVVSNIPGTAGMFWGDHTLYCANPELGRIAAKLLRERHLNRVKEVLGGIKLFMWRRKADAFVTSGDLTGLTLGCLQTVFPWRKKPHVLVDCLWHRSSEIHLAVASFLRRFAGKSVTKYVVWASHEVEDYAEVFRIRQDLFEYVHFWHTLAGYTFDVRDEGYVFAGGNWDRDYRTVLETAKELPNVPFVIGTTRPEQLDGCEIPPNVTVKGFSAGGFRQAIASCRIMLVPMDKGPLHSGGQQTVLNAMYMGKPTIAFGQRWAKDLIQDGKDGFIVDYESPRALSKVIRELWDDSARSRAVGERAAEEAKAWPPARSLEYIYRLVLGLDESSSLS